MYCNGKLFRGPKTIFLFFPCIIYFVITTLLLEVEGARTPLTPRDVTEAQRSIGHFLGNELGTKWLSKVARTHSTPLTTTDLMNEILQATKKGSEVWNAATILLEALKLKNSDGARQDSIMGSPDNWKDLIADIELEDDIICLYRNSLNETTKKADDWKKFLATVSPGYTVHLALDTGRKYMICLKKLNVAEAVEDERTTREMQGEIMSGVLRKQSQPETTSQLSKKEETSAVSSSAITENSTEEEIHYRRDNSPSKCQDKKHKKDSDDDDGSSEETAREDYSMDDDDSYKNTHARKDNRRETVKDFRPEIRGPGILDWDIRNDRGNIYSRTIDYSRPDFRFRQAGDCNRQIIFFSPQGNGLTSNQVRSPMGLWSQENVGQNSYWKDRGFSRVSVLQNSYYSPNNVPGSIGAQNFDKTKFDYQAAPSKINPYLPPVLFRGRASERKMENDRFPKLTPIHIRKTPSQQYFIPKSVRTENLRGRAPWVGNQRYPTRNYQPVQFRDSSYQNIRNDGRSSVPGRSSFDQWKSSINIPAGNPYRFGGPAYYRSPRFPREKTGYGDRQRIGNAGGLGQEPREQFFGPQRLDVTTRPAQTLIGYPTMNAPQVSMQKFTRFDPRLPETLGSGKKPCQLPYTSSSVVESYQFSDDLPGQSDFKNPSQLSMNSLVQLNPSFDSRSTLHPRSNYPMYAIVCPGSCDKQIKLQVIIDGQIQEPSRVTVISEPGQDLEIVGAAERELAYGSRAMNNERTDTKEPNEKVENSGPETAARMEFGDKENEESTSIGNTPADVADTPEDEKSTNPNETDITSSRSETKVDGALDIGPRFLSETNVATRSDVEGNETLATTTSSPSVL